MYAALVSVCFKALSRMSSFPTDQDVNRIKWQKLSFKALSRMSSFPTREIQNRTPGMVVNDRFKALSRMSSFPTTTCHTLSAAHQGVSKRCRA